MGHGAMALPGATDQVGRASKDKRVERGAKKPRRPSQRERLLLLVGRSLVVCTVLGVGFGALVGLNQDISGMRGAQAATQPAMIQAILKPRVRLAPTVTTLLDEEPFTTGKLDRVDRVHHDFLLPESALGSGDPDEVLQFGPMRIRRHLVETIIKAARVTNADPVLLMAIADKESSFATAVQARTSSATGLFQFIEKTWLHVVYHFGAKHGLEREAKALAWVDDELVVTDPAERVRILELRRDPYLSALLAAEMLTRDRNRIARRIGRDLTHGETYLAHFLGPDDAERFMEKVVGEPGLAAAKLLPKPARANKPIFFARVGRKAKSLSVAEVHQKFSAMMDLRLDRYRNVHRVTQPLAFAEAETQ